MIFLALLRLFSLFMTIERYSLFWLIAIIPFNYNSANPYYTNLSLFLVMTIKLSITYSNTACLKFEVGLIKVWVIYISSPIVDMSLYWHVNFRPREGIFGAQLTE